MITRPGCNLLLIAKRPGNVPAPVNYAQPIPLKAMALYADQVLIGGYYELTAWSRTDGKLMQRYPACHNARWAWPFIPISDMWLSLAVSQEVGASC